MSAQRVAPAPTLDAAAIRADFPIFQQQHVSGVDLAYLDSAATSQRPAPVIETVSDYYRTSNANIHRGVYELSERSTALYEGARQTVAEFINANDARECVFVRNTTEAINLVAATWGRKHVRSGDLLVFTAMDHHSNIVPWQLLAEQTGAEVAAVGITPEGLLDLDSFEALLRREPRVVALPWVSNSIGTLNPVRELVARAKAAGAITVVDGAQSVPHMPTDVRDVGCDFLAFSGHKMLGPMGSGVLWGRAELLDAMPPFMGGGGMIRAVTVEKSRWADIPARFEAGTPAVADAVGLAAAVDYLQAIGLPAIREHEIALTATALERLAEAPGVIVHGPMDAAARGGVISFTVTDIHPHDVAAVLDSVGVAVRAGHHCCQPLMDTLGVPATSRASFYLYNDESEIDRLIAGIARARELFGLQDE